jgi:hypothetical protein
MNEATNHCHARGYLVGARTEIPDDEHEYARPGAPVVGCNRIACSACGARVRQWRGVRLADTPYDADAHAALFATDEPDGARFFTRDHGGELFRVYACRCSATETSNALDLARGFIEFDWWACDGHPERS